MQNPLFSSNSLQFNFPSFDKVKNEHYGPAFDAGMQEHLNEIAVIVDNNDPATFTNTIVAMELSGQLLDRVSRVFFALASANTNDDIEALRVEYSTTLSAHYDSILLDPGLFSRIKSVYQSVDSLNIDAESTHLVKKIHDDFISAGAELHHNDKETLKALNAELASASTAFSQNVNNEVNAKAIVFETEEQLDGLSATQIASAKEAAESRGLNGKFVIPLMNTSQQPVLASLTDRDVRETILRTSLSRGSAGGEFDNTALLSKVMSLRAQRAKLLGYQNYASMSLVNQTAKTVEAVNDLLAKLTSSAVANAQKEATQLQSMVNSNGETFELKAWDWDFYSQQVRAKQYNFDESELTPYLEMQTVLRKGVFFTAEKLYGLRFKERHDLPRYHPDVKVWEVLEEDGSSLALFIQDYYARKSKRGGAWMNAFVSQNSLMDAKAVIANTMNIPKPPAGEPTLLTWSEVTTMFHEFGHALHGMFSKVRYPSFSGTSVPRDFVEYPSQVNEMWADWPEVLANFAIHVETGQPMPRKLLDKVIASSKFNQGYSTTEYLAGALLDQAWHQLTPEQVPNAEDVLDFETKALSHVGLNLETIPPRYRSTYFSHIMGGYAAGYYAYVWSEVLDADTVDWFKENGGMTRANGDRFRKLVLSRGGSKEAMEMYQEFRGAEPKIDALLKRKGLI